MNRTESTMYSAFKFLALVLLVQLSTSVLALSDDEQKMFDIINDDDADDVLRSFIQDREVDINVKGMGEQTPLMFAVLRGKEHSVKVLLDTGADATIGEADGYTPMHGAGFQGRANVVKLLADHGLDLNDMHSDGFTGMHRACWGNQGRHAETVQAFIDAGVPYDQPSKKGGTCWEETRNGHTREVLKKAMAVAGGKEEL